MWVVMLGAVAATLPPGGGGETIKPKTKCHQEDNGVER